MRTRAIILDIEGTMSPISFVKDVLFPYARERLPETIRTRHAEPQVAAAIREVARLAEMRSVDLEAVIQVLLEWCDSDRKVLPLKVLQGLIWQRGYEEGALRAPVYPDVLPAIRSWSASGAALYIYSSGSIEAQQLLMRYSTAGDLSGYLSGYFDLTTGSKLESDSYRAIRAAIGHEAGELLFLSDSLAEVAAARDAGWQVRLVQRDAPPADCEFPIARNFADVLPDARA